MEDKTCAHKVIYAMRDSSGTVAVADEELDVEVSVFQVVHASHAQPVLKRVPGDPLRIALASLSRDGHHCVDLGGNDS